MQGRRCHHRQGERWTDRDMEEGDQEGQEPWYPARGGRTIKAQSERDKGKLLMKPLFACPEESLRNGGARSMAQGAGGGQSPIVRRPFPHSAWLCTPAWGRGGDRLGDTCSLAGRLALSGGDTEALEHPQRQLKDRWVNHPNPTEPLPPGGPCPGY